MPPLLTRTIAALAVLVRVFAMLAVLVRVFAALVVFVSSSFGGCPCWVNHKSGCKGTTFFLNVQIISKKKAK